MGIDGRNRPGKLCCEGGAVVNGFGVDLSVIITH